MKTNFIFTLKIFVCFALGSFNAAAQNLNLDTNFAPSVNDNILVTAVQADQKILIGGLFTSVNGITRNKIARLNQDGTLDTSFDAGAEVRAEHFVKFIKVLPDGKVLLGGYFGSGTLGAKRILKLNTNGSLDANFTAIPSTVGSGEMVNAIESLPNGKILMCGNFTEATHPSQLYLARYNADGSYDTSAPQTNLNGICNDVKSLPDGKVFVAGFFTAVNNGNGMRLVRLNQDGSLDNGFSAPLPSYFPNFRNIVVQPDGKIIVYRTYYVGLMGTPYSAVVRLDTNGQELAGETVSPPDSEVKAIAIQNDGKILIAGNFNDSNDLPTRFTRLNSTVNYDLTLGRIEFSDAVNSVGVQADGKVVVVGNFQTVNGVSRLRVARLIPAMLPVRKTAFDFDGDGKADISVFRPSNGTWYLNRSSSGFTAVQFGVASDKPVAADYDGDGKSDIAVYRNGIWYYLRSSDSAFAYYSLGATGDIPQVGDYDGDGKADFAVFRPNQTSPKWIIQRSTQGAVTLQIGTEISTDKPVAADYDGDGVTDIAVYRNGLWIIKGSLNNSITSTYFGASEDRALSGDFDGDSRTDLAVFRPSNGIWYFQNSTQGFSAVQFGIGTDTPVPADYDGDGKADVAVYRSGTWYQLRSSGSVFYGEQFGDSNDLPIPARSGF